MHDVHPESANHIARQPFRWKCLRRRIEAAVKADDRKNRFDGARGAAKMWTNIRTVEAEVALSLCDLVFRASTLPRLRGGINSAHHGGKDKQEEEKKRDVARLEVPGTQAHFLFFTRPSQRRANKNVANGTRHINIAFAFRGVTFSCAPYQPKANIAHF